MYSIGNDSKKNGQWALFRETQKKIWNVINILKYSLGIPGKESRGLGKLIPKSIQRRHAHYSFMVSGRPDYEYFCVLVRRKTLRYIRGAGIARML